MAEQHKASYGRDQVVSIINSVISKVERTDGVSRDTIYQELRQLQKIIEDTRREMGFANPSDINNTHIPNATDELDAVVSATAEATGTIMDECEKIEALAEAMPGDSGTEITGAVTRIYEACSFQDITGQRIKKVVTTLTTIEQKISHLIEVMGGLPAGSVEPQGDTRTGDAALLNGPQMPDKAISQDEIDKLLDGF